MRSRIKDLEARLAVAETTLSASKKRALLPESPELLPPELPWWAAHVMFDDEWRLLPACELNPKINEEKYDSTVSSLLFVNHVRS
jgi:hypothetical protein